jgi:hypothetical protein
MGFAILRAIVTGNSGDSSVNDVLPNTVTIGPSGNIPKIPLAVIEQIANGHGWEDHQGEFRDWSQSDYQQAVQDTIDDPSDYKSLQDGRKAYWNDKLDMVVVVNPQDPDGGTAFRPKDGKDYFNRLK